MSRHHVRGLAFTSFVSLLALTWLACGTSSDSAIDGDGGNPPGARSDAAASADGSQSPDGAPIGTNDGSGGTNDSSSPSDGGTTDTAPSGPPAACTSTSGTTLSAYTFCMNLDSRSVITELRYGSSSTSVAVENAQTNVPRGGSVSGLSAQDTASGVKTLTYGYSGGGTGSTMTVTSYPRFLDFQLTGTTGSPGDITMLHAAFPLNSTDFNSTLVSSGGMVNFAELPNGMYAGIIPANPQTQVWTSSSGLLEVNAVSAASLPAASPSGYSRGQRFAFFVSSSSDLAQTLADIDAAYSIPVGVKMKLRPESNWDYFFLTDTGGASSADIISLLQSLGFKSVLLELHVWCDWESPNAAWSVKPGAQQLVADLKAAGMFVGAHSFVHQLPVGGYYAKTHPEMVDSAVQGDVGYLYKYDTTLLETAATDYANAIKSLGTEWVYFDGAESLWDNAGTVSESLNWYLRPLISGTMLSHLVAVGAEPAIMQQSATFIDSYPYYTRYGQLDYWDNGTQSPTKIINGIESYAPTGPLAQAFLRPDLGWFGTCIHTNSGCRAPTQEEWQLWTQTSVKYDIPLGLEADYTSLNNSPMKSTIVQLVHDAIKQRGGTP